MRFCAKCRKEFDENTAYKMCGKCRERNRRYQRERKEREPGRPRGVDIKNLDKKIQAAKKRGRKKETITDPLVLFEFERRAYNAEHGTNYSYGFYRAYKERGWLDK